MPPTKEKQTICLDGQSKHTCVCMQLSPQFHAYTIHYPINLSCKKTPKNPMTKLDTHILFTPNHPVSKINETPMKNPDTQSSTFILPNPYPTNANIL